MTGSTQVPTTLTGISVAMFTVADQDAAIAFYRDKLGFELRADTPYGENGEFRWVEVAPAGSAARLALNPPMGSEPGGASIGVESHDATAEHQRLTSAGGIDVDSHVMEMAGAPPMFMLRDPDGNVIVVVQAMPA